MSITIIDKNNPKRWVLVQDNNTGADSLRCFGYIGDIGVVQLATGQPNVNVFLNENTLEAFVNMIAENPNYYKDAVEIMSPLFTGISGKYAPIDPPSPPPEIL